ncbi:MAG: TolC family protein, partial [Candidatus Omnitrophota bacterium]
ATGTDVAIDFTNTREWSDSPYATTNPSHESMGSISLTQPIAKNFFGLIDRGEIEILKYEIQNTGLDSYIKIEDYMVDSEKAYWDLVLAYEKVNIRKEMLERATTLFDQYKKNLEIGLAESGDVLGVEANMHIRESELLIAENDLKSAEELLKVKLNIKNDVTLIPTNTLEAEDIPDDFTENLKIAFNNRRDYLRDKNSIEAKKINLTMKKNSLFPEIDLKATLAQNGIDSKYNQAIQDVIEDSNPKYYVGLTFSFPLENNEAKSERKKADLEKTKAIITLQKTERDIISDVDEKFRSKNIKKQHHSNMEKVLALQEGKLLQEEKKFKHGRSNSDLLIRYQEDLLNAELTSKKSLYDYKVSLVELLESEDYYLKHIGLE